MKGLLTESTAQSPSELNLPSHFRQLVDSFTINQNYYEIARTIQLIGVEEKLCQLIFLEVKVLQLSALPNFGRNRTCQRISVNW